MTITHSELLLYAGALAILFFTPGPVWVALTARTLSGGFHAAWPLALGVVIGDALWPFLAILGVTWVVSVFAGFMTVLRWVACGDLRDHGRADHPQRRQDHRHRQPPDPARHVGGVRRRRRGDPRQSQGDPVLHGRAARILRPDRA